MEASAENLVTKKHGDKRTVYPRNNVTRTVTDRLVAGLHRCEWTKSKGYLSTEMCSRI
jgi:hypothetical protein